MCETGIFFAGEDEKYKNYESFIICSGIATSCGCTRVEYDKRPLPAGGVTRIRIVYAAEETGYFRKTVSIYCNTADSPLRIVVTGTADK